MPSGDDSWRTTVPTFGVEEEFLLVDRATRRPVAAAPEVLAVARAAGLGDQVQAEFFPTQIEINSRPAATTGALRHELAVLRRRVADAAGEAHCSIVACGVPVIPARRPVAVSASPRYRRMARRLRRVAHTLGEGVCGMHVHLGIDDRDLAVAVSNHLRPWLPVVQALAANSPFQEGRDSGYASWRAIRWGRWPTVGPSPLLPDAAAYDEMVDLLVRSGTLLDRRMIYWYARLSEHVPTLEIRVADTNADLETTVLIAALVRGLGTTALADIDKGLPAPAPPDQLLRAAHWRAARDGLSGQAVDPRTAALVPAYDLALALAGHAAPGLRAAGDPDTARASLARLRALGDGATRQRREFARRGRLRDVVDALAAETAMAGEPDADPDPVPVPS